MKIFEVKNIWSNGKITKQSLVSKLSYKELELKEGETAQVDFDNDDKAEKFVKYAKSIGLSVKDITEEEKRKQEEEAKKKQDEQKKEQPVEEQQVEDKQEEQKTSSNKKNKK